MRKMQKKFVQAEIRNASNYVEQTIMEIAEVYSPPIMAAMAAQLGFNPGFSLDLTTTNDAGEPWDLSDKRTQDAAI